MVLRWKPIKTSALVNTYLARKMSQHQTYIDKLSSHS